MVVLKSEAQRFSVAEVGGEKEGQDFCLLEPENKIPGKTKHLELVKVHLKALLTS